MLALIIAVRAFVLAASTGLFYTVCIDDGPAKTLQGYLKLGYHRTIEMPKLLAYSAPLRTRSSYDAPPFSIVPPAGTPEVSRAGSQKLAGDDTLLDVHPVEPAHNSSTAVCPFAPTKTHSSHRFLPALGSWTNATFPTALVIHAQTLRNATLPTSLVVRSRLLQNQLSAVPEALQYGLSKSFGDVPSDLPFLFQFCLIIFLLGILFAIYVTLRYRTAKAEAVARIEHKSSASFTDIIISNTNIQGQSKHLEDLSRGTAVQAALAKIPIAEMVDGLEKQQTRIDLGEVITPEAALKQEIESLESNILDSTVSQETVNKVYEDLDKLYQSTRESNNSLGETNKSLERQIHDLSNDLDSTRDNKDRQIAVLEVKVDELTHEVKQVTANADSLEGKCRGLAFENTRLEQAKSDLESRNDDLACSLTASETSVSNLSKEIGECEAQKQQAHNTCKSMQLAINTRVQELDSMRSERDVFSQQAKESQTQAKTCEEALARSQVKVKRMLAEKDSTAMELKKAKEEKEALVKKVAALSTARASPSQPAPGTDDTLRPPNSLILPTRSPADANNFSASFNTSSNPYVPNQGPVSQQHLSTITQNYENRVEVLRTKLSTSEHERNMLKARLGSGHRGTGSLSPPPMTVPSVHRHQSGIPPMPFHGHSAHAQLIPGDGLHRNFTGAWSRYDGGPIGHTMGPAGSPGYMSFPPGGGSQGMNSSFLPHPPAHNGPNSSTSNYQWPPPTPQSHPSPLNNGGPAVLPGAQDGHLYNSLDPGAASFTPGRGT
ncbi:MAG: hypothetical protein Q9192_005627 [Flavoplaca navasiana]